MSALIAEILPLIETSIPKAVHLELSLPPGLPWIRADASEIQQIVMNLVINGAEAIGPGGGSLSGVRPEKVIPMAFILEVRDSGCGMDEATQRRIFEPFFTTKFTGRGLGLAAVSGIVRRLKGRLDWKARREQGSTFRIVFPGVPAQLPEPKTTAERRSAWHRAHPGSRRRSHGPEPRARSSGTIRIFRSDRRERQGGGDLFRRNADTITAVLLDLTMPVMGGGEAFRLMNEIRPEIPIIISSGYGESAIREQFTGALAGVIRKP